MINTKKFRDLAMGALFLAVTLGTSGQAMANDSNEAPVITQEAVSSFFANAWGKTKEVSGKVLEVSKEVGEKALDTSKDVGGKVIDKTKEVATDTGVVVGKGMQTVGKGLEKLAEPEKPQPSKAQEKTAQKTEKKKSEPQVQKAEFSQPGAENNNIAENLIKAKDEAVNLVIDLPSKLSVEKNQVAENLVKAKDEAVGLIGGLIGKWRSNPSNSPSNSNSPN